MDKLIAKHLIVGISLMGLMGCHGGINRTAKPIGVINTDTRVSLSNEEAVTRSLYAQLRDWRAVEYDYGGLSKDGVDCSGFVYLTYLMHFGVELPRTASEQATVGRWVAQRDVRPGDLVFFKTGRRSRHVGIVVDGRKFVHASKSRGVMMSSLDDRYWSERYWQAKRIGGEPSTTARHRQDVFLSACTVNVEARLSEAAV